MRVSKQQIFIIYKCNSINQIIGVSMVTLSIMKLKAFVIKQIKNDNPDIFYNNERISKSAQVKEFKSDWKILTRDKINNKLYGIKYDYVHDGEEL